MKQRTKVQQDFKQFEEMCQASSSGASGVVVIGANSRKPLNMDLPIKSKEYSLEKKIQTWELILDKIHEKLKVHLSEAPFEHQYKLAYIHFFLTQIFDYAKKSNSSGNMSATGNASKISSTELASAYIVSSYLRINKIRKKLQQVIINNNVRSKESHIHQFLDIMSGHDPCLQTKEYKGVADRSSQIKKTILNWILQIKITKQNRAHQQAFLERHYDIPADSDVLHKIDPPIKVKIGDFLNLAKIMFFNSSTEDEMKRVLTSIRQNLKWIISPPQPLPNNGSPVTPQPPKPQKPQEQSDENASSPSDQPEDGTTNGEESGNNITFSIYCPDRRYQPSSILFFKYFVATRGLHNSDPSIDPHDTNVHNPRIFSDIKILF